MSQLLNPNATDGLYGPLLQVGAGLLGTETTRPDGTTIDVEPLFSWLGQVARQRSGDGADLVGILDRMLATDEQDALQAIGRNLVSPGPLESSETPAGTFGSIFDSVTDVSEPMMCSVDDDLRFTVEQADDTVQSLVDFMNADDGLGAIYQLIGLRRDGPATRAED